MNIAILNVKIISKIESYFNLLNYRMVCELNTRAFWLKIHVFWYIGFG
jgi:hypothetical protein